MNNFWQFKAIFIRFYPSTAPNRYENIQVISIYDPRMESMRSYFDFLNWESISFQYLKNYKYRRFNWSNFHYRFISKSIGQFDSTFLLNWTLIAFRFSFYYDPLRYIFTTYRKKAKGSRGSMENLIQLNAKFIIAQAKFKSSNAKQNGTSEIDESEECAQFIPSQTKSTL